MSSANRSHYEMTENSKNLFVPTVKDNNNIGTIKICRELNFKDSFSALQLNSTDILVFSVLTPNEKRGILYV